jgi:hypothetical protein
MATTRKKPSNTIEEAISQEPLEPLEAEALESESKYVDETYQQAVNQAKLASLINSNTSFTQNMDERKSYARKIYNLTIGWAITIFVILFLKGWHLLDLSDKVIITLISSTTINFFGFFFLVTKYLFNAGNDKSTTTKAKPKPRRAEKNK